MLETKATIDPAALRALLGACDELASVLEILARRGRAIRKIGDQTSGDDQDDDQPGTQKGKA